MPELSLKIVVRASTDADVPAMLAIYHHHISTGLNPQAMDSEVGLMEAEDMQRRRRNMRKRRLPHLVAEVSGIVAGYAYAVPFRKRPAYRHTIKHSIYVHHQFANHGIGRTLLPALIDTCAAAGYRQLIGYIDPSNEASLRLHESLGFERVGLLRQVAFKFGQWFDSVIVQRPLGAGGNTQPGTWSGVPDRAEQTD